MTGKAHSQDSRKTKAQLLEALTKLRQQVAAMEAVADNQDSGQTALLEDRTTFDEVLNIATEAIISIDQDYRVTLFNKGAEQIFGYAADEVLGQSLNKLIPSELTDVHNQHIAQFAASEATSRLMGRSK
jgi:PAS domain-containing protein